MLAHLAHLAVFDPLFVLLVGVLFLRKSLKASNAVERWWLLFLSYLWVFMAGLVSAGILIQPHS